MFEVKVKLLRVLYTEYLQQSFPAHEWTNDMNKLFDTLKSDVTCSPVMGRFDCTRPCFLKTDWSSRDMLLIVMQVDDSAESIKVLENLQPYQDNEFDTHINGARLQPTVAGCRICT